MSGKHTPGPWKASHDGAWVLATMPHGDMEIANICGYSVAHGVQRITNAQLLAAAPDLLEAAKDALAGWNYIRAQHGDLYGVGWDRVERALSAAIAKAEGRS